MRSSSYLSLTSLLLILLSCTTPTVQPLATPSAGLKVVGGYLLLNPSTAASKLKALASNAAKIPVNRIFLSFVAPTMVYVPGSKTLKYADIGYKKGGDYGFAEVKKYVGLLQKGGVEVFLSMGGWNFNCFPYFYMKYSISSFPTGPNYWKIQQYGNNSASNCNATNMWCYVCEPQSSNTTLSDFVIFPEPAKTKTWKRAQAQVEAASKTAKGMPVKWNPQFIGGAVVTDGAMSVTVPGDNTWFKKGRDPYQDFVYLAKDLGLDGVDLDYEEIWHADTFRSGTVPGPFKIDQTVYKYAAISFDIINNIKAIYPACKFGTAAGAAGAWQGNWWGGNLKGLWYYLNLWYPEVINFMATGKNAGGINVMTYDLSNNNAHFECPSGQTADCDLAGQVQFYMETYANASIPARVGYEVGQPAYPDPTNDAAHQLPLTKAGLSAIINGVATSSTLGGFFWELYKPKNSEPTGVTGQPNNIDANTVARQVCKAVIPNAARCNGSIPQIPGISSAMGGGDAGYGHSMNGFPGNSGSGNPNGAGGSGGGAKQ
ncbi:hypothetical protein BDR26DRAFT_874417 [Obelidium mucronatum]|nr:hypothetical protein BDR26DRAFT_874417 [Obelidium mucronatum]